LAKSLRRWAARFFVVPSPSCPFNRLAVSLPAFRLATLPDFSEKFSAPGNRPRRAQRQVYERYAGRLFRVALRYLRQHADAEDALVRGFQKAFAQLPRFEFHDAARLVGWLKTIVVSECLMQLRQRSSFALVPDWEAADVPVDEEALDRLSAEEIRDLIRQLPDGYRTVFNLYAIEGYNHAEIAQRLGINEGPNMAG